MPNILENMDFCKPLMDFSWYESTMQNYYREVCNKKELIVKQKLIEKGFEHLIEGMQKRKFPKVMCIVQDEWSYYYADNDTDEGAFIVAIKDLQPEYNSTELRTNVTFEFQWQDNIPLINYFK